MSIVLLSPDIDECDEEIHKCHKNARCTNFVGTYKCHCEDGFKHMSNGRYCFKGKTLKSDCCQWIVDGLRWSFFYRNLEWRDRSGDFYYFWRVSFYIICYLDTLLLLFITVS